MNGGENAGGVPCAPSAFGIGPAALLITTHCPFGVGLFAVCALFGSTPTDSRHGAFVCVDRLTDIDPWTLSPSVTRALSCSSMPLISKFGPWTLNVVLPRNAGSNNDTCSSFH